MNQTRLAGVSARRLVKPRLRAGKIPEGAKKGETETGKGPVPGAAC